MGDVSINEYVERIRSFEVVSANLSIEALIQVVEVFSMVFCDHIEPAEQQARNLVIFGAHTEVEERFRCYATKLYALKTVFDTHSSSMTDSAKQDLEAEFGRVATSIFAGRESMIFLYTQVFVNSPDLIRTLPTPRLEEFYRQITEEEMKGHHKLIRFYLQICQRRQYKKMKGVESLFEPTYTADGHFTHYYRHACDISEFIYDAIYPYAHHTAQFMQLTDRPTTPKAVVQYLASCKDDSLPFLNRSRSVFAYLNGVYDAETDRFYLYEKNDEWPYVAADLSLDVVACNYLDHVFDYQTYEDELQTRDNPLDIQTEHCQKIYDSQEFEPDVCLWSYASIGRLLFPVGKLDNWQYFLFHKGTAGSGKSTLLTLASAFYHPDDVGLLMTEGQQNFSIEHLYNKYVFFCMDADEKMTLSQTRWNQMVSGEMVSIERKFKISLTVKWETGGAFAGNGYPPWVDRGGNVSRRFLVFLHEKMVTNVDPMLMDKCRRELPAFMKKCVACYHYVRNRFGNRGIWDEGVLPAYFHNTKKDLQAATNTLQSFLQSDDQCSLGPTKSCDLSLFRNQFHLFCTKLHVTPTKLTGDTVAPVWKSHNITTVIPDMANPIPMLMGVELM